MIFAVLSACATPPSGSPGAGRADTPPIRLDFPPMQGFAGRSPGPALRPNSEIANDFLDLAFNLETGRPLPVFTRFEGPISVRVNGVAPPTLARDLNALLARLRSEAGIDIRMTSAATANITLTPVPSRDLQRLAPNAACFVVPRVTDWQQLRGARNSPLLDWASLTRRDTVGIFLPADATPQEIRDCLHEELAQALGPLNDLYRLPDSIFNDDNMHAVLTGFDMLILRAYYAPDLRNGMTQAQVRQKLPAILARINPRGQRPGGQIPRATSRAWIDAIQTALGDGASDARRRQAAARAVAIAQDMGWNDTRTGFASYAFGRLHIGHDGQAALEAFNTAARAYGQNPLTEIQAAHVAVQLAAFALITGNAEAAITLTDRAIPIARTHENAALLSVLMMFKAEALDLQGKTAQAQAQRLDSLGWGLYGFGSRDEVVARLNEIASLPPRTPPS